MKTWNRIKDRLLAFHKDEKGADMVEYILIIAAVSLPLLGVIIWYWHDISKWAKSLWDNAKDDTKAGTDPSSLG
jgi:Flp pilus assembly pilin Flp